MHIILQDITKRFGSVLANDQVSITVAAGTVHGLLGENGAGKSTLVKILSGFLRPDGGQISLDQRVVSIAHPQGAIAHGIGMLHQDPLDFPPLSVLDNFLVGKGWQAKGQAQKQLRALGDEFGFDLAPNQIVATLTVGERQQLEILRLLSLGIKTLILDEPTTGISANQKEALFRAARRLADQGRSVIFVSHKLEDVEVLCDQVTVMRRGRVVGHRQIPCPASELVELMFGQELATPTKPSTTQPEISLELENILIRDTRLEINIPRLQTHRGEVIGLAGLEGCGQRLLILLCAGLLAPQRGRISLAGLDLTHQPYSRYRQAGVGYLPADRLQEGLIPGLSIQDHVTIRQFQHQWLIDQQATLARARALIDLFNIRGYPSSRVEDLSGGNQQRTQLALLPNPLNLVLMEHPTRGLDIASTLWVWQQLLDRCRQGTTIIFTSADLDELIQYSDRLIIFSGTRVSGAIPTGQLNLDQLGRAIGGQNLEQLTIKTQFQP